MLHRNPSYVQTKWFKYQSKNVHLLIRIMEVQSLKRLHTIQSIDCFESMVNTVQRAYVITLTGLSISFHFSMLRCCTLCYSKATTACKRFGCGYKLIKSESAELQLNHENHNLDVKICHFMEITKRLYAEQLNICSVFFFFSLSMHPPHLSFMFFFSLYVLVSKHFANITRIPYIRCPRQWIK